MSMIHTHMFAQMCVMLVGDHSVLKRAIAPQSLRHT